MLFDIKGNDTFRKQEQRSMEVTHYFCSQIVILHRGCPTRENRIFNKLLVLVIRVDTIFNARMWMRY